MNRLVFCVAVGLGLLYWGGVLGGAWLIGYALHPAIVRLLTASEFHGVSIGIYLVIGGCLAREIGLFVTKLHATS